MTEPRRAHVVTIKIGADTIKDVESELIDIARRIAVREIGHPGSYASGGVSSGHTIEWDTDESWTRERYFEAIDERRKEKSEDGEWR